LNPNYKLGYVLWKLKHERGFTWTELAQKAGISRAYLYKLLDGVDPRSGKPSYPTIKVLIDIADALEISRIEFLRQCGYIEKQEQSDS